MSIIYVKQLKFRYADKELYQSVSMRLLRGEHAVLVGDNGTGKTTLLKLIAKELRPDEGVIEYATNVKVGYLDQYALIDQTLDVKTYLYDVFTPLLAKEQQQHTLYESLSVADPNDYDRILNWAHKLGEELEASSFYAIQSKVSNVLNGLGLGTNILDMPISHLSGGMRSKLILANLLLKEADCLLLDEPTNFLDAKHVDWLAKFLIGFSGSFIVISHNEDFLRSIGNVVLGLENKTITRYKGNFDFYLAERNLRQTQTVKNYEAQTRFIKQTEDFIKKNIVRASTTKRAQSRRKMLEKIVRLDKPIIKKPIRFQFKLGKSLSQEVLLLNDFEIGYAEPLVEPISGLIKKGDKVVITGRNGIGKTTLIKSILDLIPPLGGSAKWADSAQILYFEQDMLRDINLTPYQLIINDEPHLTKQDILSILGGYHINHDLATRSLNTLSGGEKARVKFALMRNHKSNILILDEPTNHLDFDTKESLRIALKEYHGVIILVSHEREFYADICDYEIELS